MTGKKPPVQLDDEQLSETAGGGDSAQRSRVSSLTVTFTAQTNFNHDDPDKPIVIGSVPNPAG